MQLAQPRPNLALYLAGLLIAAMVFAGPIGQPAHYHAFADQRLLLGIPHAADVLSNLGFLAVGLYGLLLLLRGRVRTPAYAVFFGALVLTALGSSWYHLAPDNARLVWDRLPIALACAALLAAALQEGYPARRHAATWLAGLTLFGAASVFWWSLTADLRPYLLIQIAPLVLIPALQWQTNAPPARRKAFGIAIGLYVLAKVFELGDAAVFETVHALSGHTVKHVLATLAAYVLVKQSSTAGGAPARV